MNQNENFGTLGKSKTYTEGSSRPEYSGSAKIGGVDYWVAGWPRETNGSPWIKLEFTKKEKML